MRTRDKLKKCIKDNPFLYRCLTEYQARRQDWHTIFVNKLHQYMIKRNHVEVYKGERLRGALLERLAARGISPGPKKGNPGLEMFLAFSLTDWEAVLPTSLKVFGRVNVFEWRSRGYDDRLPGWARARYDMNKEMLRTFLEINSKNKIDLVVGYLSGFTVAPEILTQMAHSGAIIVNFCWDDKIKFPGKRVGGRYKSTAAIAPFVDLNLTNSPDSLARYSLYGGLSMFWPEAAEPTIHRPYQVPFKCDVSFVGRKYAWRPIIIDKLRDMGINVATFGPGWDNGPLPAEEVVKIYSSSRINLGFSGTGYSRRMMCLKGIDFEIPMSGGLYLTEDFPDLRLVYELDEEIMTYTNPTDCANKIRWLLANPLEAEKIRAAGRARAIRDHTWQKRFEELFNFIGLSG